MNMSYVCVWYNNVCFCHIIMYNLVPHFMLLTIGIKLEIRCCSAVASLQQDSTIKSLILSKLKRFSYLTLKPER